MTQAQHECSISDHTGQSPRTLRRRGLGPQAKTPRHHDPQDVRPVVNGPSCVCPVSDSQGSPATAGCSDSRCDFDLAITDVHVIRP